MKHSERCRNQMYVCDCDRLAPDIRELIDIRSGEDAKRNGKYDVSRLVEWLDNQLGGKQKIVAIVHDMDIKRDKNGKPLLDESGNQIPRAPHLHIGRHSENPTSLSQFAKVMMEPPERVATAQNVENFEKKYNRHSWENLVSYLFHRSKKARAQGKFQYPFNWGSGNFDFKGLIKATAEKMAQKNHKSAAANRRNKVAEQEDKVDELVQDILAGKRQVYDYAYDEDLALAYVTDRTTLENAQDVWAHKAYRYYNAYRSALNKVAATREQKIAQENDVKKWLHEMKNINFNATKSHNYYIYGTAGAGKTQLATLIAANYDSHDMPRGVYTAEGEKNQFDGFENEYAMVLDDVRPQSFGASTWTRLLDPNIAVRKISKRYHNGIASNLQCVCLTNTQPLDSFVRFIKNKGSVAEPEDQYFRRFETVINCHDSEKVKLSNGEVRLMITYDVYEMRKSKEFKKGVMNDGGTTKVFEQAKQRGYQRLNIYKKDDHGNYMVYEASQYYLLRKAKDKKILVRFPESDDDSGSRNKRAVNATLEAKNEEVERMLDPLPFEVNGEPTIVKDDYKDGDEEEKQQEAFKYDTVELIDEDDDRQINQKLEVPNEALPVDDDLPF